MIGIRFILLIILLHTNSFYSQNKKNTELYQKADKLCQDGSFSEAIRLIDQSSPGINSDFKCENHSKLLLLKSLALLSSNMLTKGVDNLSLIINQCSNSPEYYLALDQRARVYYHLKQYKESAKDLEKLLVSTDYNNEENNLLLYICYYNLNDNYNQRLVVDRALKLKSKTSMSFYMAAEFYLTNSDNKIKGLNYLKNALDFDDNSKEKIKAFYQDLLYSIDDLYNAAINSIETEDFLAAKQNIIYFNSWSESWYQSELIDSLNFKHKSDKIVCIYNNKLYDKSKNIISQIKELEYNYNYNNDNLTIITNKNKSLKKNIYNFFPKNCNLDIEEIKNFTTETISWTISKTAEVELLLKRKKYAEYVEWVKKQPWGHLFNEETGKYDVDLASFFASKEWVGGDDDESKSKTIRKGKRGGKYYISNKGNKVYVPRSTPHQAED